jgi:hypothetical protein
MPGKGPCWRRRRSKPSKLPAQRRPSARPTRIGRCARTRGCSAGFWATPCASSRASSNPPSRRPMRHPKSSAPTSNRAPFAVRVRLARAGARPAASSAPGGRGVRVSSGLARSAPEIRGSPAQRRRAVRQRAAHRLAGLAEHPRIALLRSALPINLRAYKPGFVVWSQARADIDRILTIWGECFRTWHGPCCSANSRRWPTPCMRRCARALRPMTSG